MSYIVFNALSERSAYRHCAAVDILLGFPRVHPESELVRLGRGPHAKVVRTETKARPIRLADGRFAVYVDDEVDALTGRTVAVQDGGRVDVTVDTSAAVELDARGAEMLAVRGGLKGSTTGVPR